jgi:hypothetical protein
LDNLPRKNEHKLSWAKTVNHSEDVGEVLNRLSKEGVNVCEIIRIATREYLRKHKLID